MTFGSPLWLLALVAVPVLLAAYVASRRRAKRYAVRFTATSTCDSPRARCPPGRATCRRARARGAGHARGLLGQAAEDRGRRRSARVDHARHRPLELIKATNIQPNRLTTAQPPPATSSQPPQRHPRRCRRVLRTPDAVQRPAPTTTPHGAWSTRSPTARPTPATPSKSRSTPSATTSRTASGHRRPSSPSRTARRPPAQTPSPSPTSPGSCVSPSTPSRWATSTRRSQPQPLRAAHPRSPLSRDPRRISQASGGRAFTAGTPSRSTPSTRRWARNWASKKEPREITRASRSARSRCFSVPAPPRCVGPVACPDRGSVPGQ